MSNLYRSIASTKTGKKQLFTDIDRAEFMTKVYSWMTAGVGLTAATALVMVMTGLAPVIASSTGAFIGLCLLQIGLVFGYTIVRPSFETSLLLLGAYSILNGVTFSVLFLIYGLGLAAEAFVITAGMFAGMAVFGHTTKKDLSGLETFFLMSLIGLLLLMVVEFFVASTIFSAGVSLLAVLLFAGLTAYDSQKIKDMQMTNSNALDGALTLYLDFINMFIHVLRLLGMSRGRD